jgi:hypothetical protein
MALTVRKGDEGAYGELIMAVGRNCTCEVPDVEHSHPPKCPAHKMIEDQTTLNRLIFAHSIAERLNREEHGKRKRQDGR